MARDQLRSAGAIAAAAAAAVVSSVSPVAIAIAAAAPISMNATVSEAVAAAMAMPDGAMPDGDSVAAAAAPTTSSILVIFANGDDCVARPTGDASAIITAKAAVAMVAGNAQPEVSIAATAADAMRFCSTGRANVIAAKAVAAVTAASSNSGAAVVSHISTGGGRGQGMLGSAAPSPSWQLFLRHNQRRCLYAPRSSNRRSSSTSPLTPVRGPLR